MSNPVTKELKDMRDRWGFITTPLIFHWVLEREETPKIAKELLLGIIRLTFCYGHTRIRCLASKLGMEKGKASTAIRWLEARRIIGRSEGREKEVWLRTDFESWGFPPSDILDLKYFVNEVDVKLNSGKNHYSELWNLQPRVVSDPTESCDEPNPETSQPNDDAGLGLPIDLIDNREYIYSNASPCSATEMPLSKATNSSNNKSGINSQDGSNKADKSIHIPESLSSSSHEETDPNLNRSLDLLVTNVDKDCAEVTPVHKEKKPRKLSPAEQERKDIFNALKVEYRRVRGYPDTTAYYPLKAMIVQWQTAGYTKEDMLGTIGYIAKDKFWGSKVWNLYKVGEFIGPYKQSKPAPIKLEDDPYANGYV